MSRETKSPYSPEAMQKVMQSPPARRRSDAGFYEPRVQECYIFHDGNWKPLSPEDQSGLDNASSSLRLLSWNIDFLIPFARPRMHAALDHLGKLVEDAERPVVIFLQEMVPPDLEQIKHADWVRQKFMITDADETKWLTTPPFSYGTTTLIDRRLTVKQAFRVPFISKFDRDGLFVDLATSKSDKIVRLCNVHLESLPADPPVRNQQMSEAKPYLHDPTVAAALLAGDCNAIEPFDRSLHTENGLKDAFLELGGSEGSDAGFTWGYQDTKHIKGRFPPCRMDKVMYRGGFEVQSLERIGVGLSVGDDEVKAQMMDALGCDWVTDHYGLDAVMELRGDIGFATLRPS